MKRGARFSDKVIAFAVTERSRGVRWKDIRNVIKKEFHIEPPSERQMRTWCKEYGGRSIDSEKMLREALVKAARHSTISEALTIQQIAIKHGIEHAALLLGKAWQDNADPWVGGGIVILSTLEHLMGSDNYDKMISGYQGIREERRKGIEKAYVDKRQSSSGRSSLEK